MVQTEASRRGLWQAGRQTDRWSGSLTSQALPYFVEMGQLGKTAHHPPRKQGDRRALAPFSKSSLPPPQGAFWMWKRMADKRLKVLKAGLNGESARVEAHPAHPSPCRRQGRTPPHKRICSSEEVGTARGKEAEDGAEARAGGLDKAAWEQAPVRLAEKWVIFLLKNSEKMEK